MSLQKYILAETEINPSSFLAVIIEIYINQDLKIQLSNNNIIHFKNMLGIKHFQIIFNRNLFVLFLYNQKQPIYIILCTKIKYACFGFDSIK